MEAQTYRPSASFIDLMIDAVFAVTKDARVVFASAACERIFGYSPEELIGKSMFDMMLPEDREMTRDSIVDVMAGLPQFHFENRYVRKDGQVVHIMWSARWSPADQLRIGVARDITERKRAEARQAMLYAIAEAAFSADDLPTLFKLIHRIVGGLLPADNFLVALYDEQTNQLSFPYHVDAHERMPQPYASATVALCADTLRTGKPLLLTADALRDRVQALTASITVMPLCWLSVPLNVHNGTIGVLVLKSYPGGVCYSEEDVELLQFVSTQIATVIERQQMQARLRYLAQHDALTALPNRGAFHDRFRAALARAKHEQGRLSVLYIDLDKFKQVNDTRGHGVGDRLLQEVAARLVQCVPASDVVARVGGDEFVILLHHLPLPEHASQVAEKIHDVLTRPYAIDGHDLSVRASIGIALYPDHGEFEQDLLKHADTAMYRMKNVDSPAIGAAIQMDDPVPADPAKPIVNPAPDEMLAHGMPGNGACVSASA